MNIGFKQIRVLECSKLNFSKYMSISKLLVNLFNLFFHHSPILIPGCKFRSAKIVSKLYNFVRCQSFGSVCNKLVVEYWAVVICFTVV